MAVKQRKKTNFERGTGWCRRRQPSLKQRRLCSAAAVRQPPAAGAAQLRELSQLFLASSSSSCGGGELRQQAAPHPHDGNGAAHERGQRPFSFSCGTLLLLLVLLLLLLMVSTSLLIVSTSLLIVTGEYPLLLIVSTFCSWWLQYIAAVSSLLFVTQGEFIAARREYIDAHGEYIATRREYIDAHGEYIATRREYIDAHGEYNTALGEQSSSSQIRMSFVFLLLCSLRCFPTAMLFTKWPLGMFFTLFFLLCPLLSLLAERGIASTCHTERRKTYRKRREVAIYKRPLS
jgi:hypothetical protein